ncbi:MAG: glycosyl transferase family 2 [Parcubacteria group bacterium]|nr:glycosyl transferase family 2 [Parcubacteria group bacterium]
MNNKEISILIPTLNEEGNISKLVERIGDSLRVGNIGYEIIFIDDHSTDGTINSIERISSLYPVSWHMKKGRKGKAHSLIEGFEYAKYDLLAMIDADLQYPPEAIPKMAQKIIDGADIVIANRIVSHKSFSRKIASRFFSLFFGKLLHSLDYDVQSGLKLFRRQIVREIKINPSPWTFDLEFLINARNAGYEIKSIDIIFEDRHSGKSKIHFFKSIYEIGINALSLKLRGIKPSKIHPNENGSMIGAGLAHKKKRFITHTTLHHSFSAIRTFAPWQKYALIIGIMALTAGFFFYPFRTAIAAMAILTTVYFIDVFFNLFLVVKSLHNPPEINFSADDIRAIDDKSLPIYSILCPLYKEARILPYFIEAIGKLDWPKDKLDVILLLEENDIETIEISKNMNLPSYIRTSIVPHSMPKTKPKACNYGLSAARGEYLVIYDAEDIPDTDQLKKAYLGFQKVSSNTKCLQAKLNYFNPHHNLLTRLFTAEYSLWFDLVLTGLQSINTFIPLGGTSNHFRTKDLLALKGWDPFNVTEDCDLGARLFKYGYKTAIINSVTLEEANSHLGNWLRQRSRWIKGYMQTYLVHMRNPIDFLKINGFHAFLMQLNIGGKIAFMLINPILWIMTFTYFALYEIVGSSIESLYPTPVFYMAVISMIFGNFLYLFYYMIGAAKRGYWPLIKYVFLIPLYWFFMSAAALIALYQLFVKPHFWEKTRHGLHLDKLKAFELKMQSKKEKLLAVQDIRPAERKKERRSRFFPIENLKRFLPKFLISGLFSKVGILVAVMMISNLLNFIFNAFLGRALGFEELGQVILINTIWSMAVIFIGAFSTTINHKTAHLAAAEDAESSASFLRSALKIGLMASFGISVIWIAIVPFLSNFFHIADKSVLFLFTPAISLGLIVSANRGYLNGNLNFGAVSFLLLAETVSKLLFAFLFVWLGLNHFVYLSIPISIAVSAIFSIWIILPKTKKVKIAKQHAFPTRFFAASFLNGVSSTIFLSLDVILVKHFLPPMLAGQYILLSLVGKIVFFLGNLPNMFTVTLVSRDQGLKRGAGRNFYFIFLGTVAFSAIGFLAVGPLGKITVPILFGEKTLAILPHLNTYTLAMAIFTISSSILLYHLALKHYISQAVSLLFSLLLAVGIILRHDSIESIARVMLFSTSLGFIATIFLHFFQGNLRFVKRNIVDFIGAFIRITRSEFSEGPFNKKILIFNWRDTKHKFSGGAETYIHQMSKRWVEQGNYVTIFCGNDSLNSREENVDGIEIIRRGGFYFVYFWAFLYYMLQFRGRYDVIIDCHNGIPFFIPFYAKEQVYCLMHHVHQDVFRHSLPKPLAWFAGILEKDLMALAYKNVKFITVSESSKKDIEKLGLGGSGIDVAYPGVDLASLTPNFEAKSPVPTILYFGRLKYYKSVDILIKAFKKVIEKIPEARLIIAGSGEESANLKDLARRLGLDSKIEFKGKVSDEEKVKLLQKTWVLANPSFMEGWGITTIEANACGTPVLAFNVPGLRDSVKDGETGYLVPRGDRDAFSEKIIRMLLDKELRERMGREGICWAKNFEWSKTSEMFLSVISQNLPDQGLKLSDVKQTL